MNLVKTMQDRTLKVVCMNESGQQISEREIHIGNSKGLIVVTVD
jgi:hypothetical protein